MAEDPSTVVSRWVTMMTEPTPNVRLRAVRERTLSRNVPGVGMSRDELAALVARWCAEHDPKHRSVAFDATHLSKIERGLVRRPRRHYIAALCAILGATEDALGFTDSDVTASATGTMSSWNRGAVAAAVERVTGEDLAVTRRQAVGVAALTGAALTEPLQRWLDPLPEIPTPGAGRAHTAPEVDALEALVVQLRGWANAGNGVLARKAVIGQLAESAERLREVPSGPLTTRAMVATARLADVAASMSWDAGAHRAAQKYYALAVQLAKVAGEGTLAAVVLAALGRQCYDLNRPDDGLEIVQLAQFGTRRIAAPRLRAMLATREAWAYAQRGQVQAFHRAVGLAQDHFTEIAKTEPRQWVDNFDQAELHGVIGARFRDLALHDPAQARHAQDHIGRALELRAPSRVRNRVFDLIGLARAALIARDLEQASALINQALPLAHRWADGRVGVKLADFHREAERFATVPAVRDARDAIHDLITV
ncbi:MAG TPA: helix-turn-helix domain-containing protein [Pseudonocardiaceae bacterium]|jgi:hypothetical protein|nr:helix-turn-helix domain-containing protein [Pseudonocardiaceae bacterium]